MSMFNIFLKKKYIYIYKYYAHSKIKLIIKEKYIYIIIQCTFTYIMTPIKVKIY